MALLSTMSAFANVYDGVGNETEYGIETCAMNVVEISNGRAKVIAFALGEALELTFMETISYLWLVMTS